MGDNRIPPDVKRQMEDRAFLAERSGPLARHLKALRVEKSDLEVGDVDWGNGFFLGKEVRKAIVDALNNDAYVDANEVKKVQGFASKDEYLFVETLLEHLTHDQPLEGRLKEIKKQLKVDACASYSVFRLFGCPTEAEKVLLKKEEESLEKFSRQVFSRR